MYLTPFQGHTWPLDVSGMPPDVRIEYRSQTAASGSSLLNLYKGTGALYVIKHVAITFCILLYKHINIVVKRESFLYRLQGDSLGAMI